MKFLVIFIGTIAIAQSSVIPYNHQVNIPASKTTILGPSGSITQLRNLLVGGYGEKSLELNTPVEITNVVGPSGSIKQEKYQESLSHPTVAKTTVTSVSTGNDDCVDGNEVNHNSVNVFQGFNRNEQLSQLNSSPIVHLNSPVLVQYKAPTNVRIGASYGTNHVSTGSTKNSIIGPSGAITQEIVSNSNTFSAQIPNIEKNLPASVKPVIVEYGLPSVQNTAVTQGTKLVYAAPENSNEVHYIVKNTPAAVNVAVEQYGLPSVYSAAHSYTTKTVSLPLEKTSVVGSSGLITQEKHVQSNIGGPTVQYGLPSIGDIAVAHGSDIVNNLSEKTSVIGPSGTITHEIHNQPTPNDYEIRSENNIPVVVQYGSPAIESIVQDQRAHVVATTPEKTTIVGPSGTITQEKYLDSTSLDQDLDCNRVNEATPVDVHLTSPTVVRYEHPVSLQHSAVVQANPVDGIPIEKTRVVGPSGSITRERYSGATKLNGALNSYPVEVQFTSPVLDSYELPASESSAVIDNTPIEKTSIIGPSGSIVQTKGLKTAVQTDGAFKIHSTQPLGYSVVGPAVSINEPHVSHIVSSPLQHTDCVESSGYITEQKVSQPNTFSYGILHQDQPVQFHYASPLVQNVGVISWERQENTPVETTYTVEQNSPASSAVINNPLQTAISYVASPISDHLTQNVLYGNNGVDYAVDRTSIVGPSGSITQEHNSNSILTHVSEVSDLPAPNEVVPYTFVKHTAPTITIADVNKNIQSYGPYPPAPKYPNIAAPDC